MAWERYSSLTSSISVVTKKPHGCLFLIWAKTQGLCMQYMLWTLQCRYTLFPQLLAPKAKTSRHNVCPTEHTQRRAALSSWAYFGFSGTQSPLTRVYNGGEGEAQWGMLIKNAGILQLTSNRLQWSVYQEELPPIYRSGVPTELWSRTAEPFVQRQQFISDGHWG